MKNLFLLSLALGSAVLFSCEKAEEVTAANTVVAAGSANSAERGARQFFDLDTESSVIQWWGSGPAASHHGTFSVTGENIEVVMGKVKAGSFTIPIASIQNFDLPDHLKPVLLEHLKSADFFDMLRYPEATFKFRKMILLTKPVEGAVQAANYLVSGDFTMLGQTHPIEFPARVLVAGEQLSIEAELNIDRTRWGMHYGADPELGDHQIYADVALHLKLLGQKQ